MGCIRWTCRINSIYRCCGIRMKTVSHPIFIIVLLVYLTYYILKHTGFEMPALITSYLADILSLFLINTLVLFILRKIYSKPNLELSVGMIVISIILITLIFEVIQPMINEYFVADPIDLLCYLISGSLYYVWRKSGYSN